MRAFLATLALVTLAPWIAQARLITFEWEGTINQQIGFSPDLVGQEIEGTYRLDTAATGGLIVQSIRAEWENGDFRVTNSSPGDVGSFTAFDAPGGDFYFVGLAPGTGRFNGKPVQTGAVIFGFDPTGELLNGSAIDTRPQASAANPLIGTFQVLGLPGSPAVGALITRVSGFEGATNAPEPAVSILLVVSAGVLAGVRRRLGA